MLRTKYGSEELTTNFEDYYKTFKLKMDTSILPEYSLKEVELHETIDDAWMVLFNRVYNVTPFLYQHPGGMEVLLENLGRDASLVFLGGGHENVPLSVLKPYLIGILPQKEHFHLPYQDWTKRIAELEDRN